jgi:DNA-binding GntR family transcriptional regulator
VGVKGLRELRKRSSSKIRTTSSERIFLAIRREIIMGRLWPGARLSIAKLSRTYGSSTIPVREALQRLSREGLVTVKPYSGFSVKSTTLAELLDMMEFRQILEVASVERAVTRITDEQLDELARLCAGYSGEEEESRDRYLEENRRFHVLIAQASGCQELADALGHLLDRLSRFLVIIRTGPLISSIHEHTVDALRSRDVERARRAALDELSDTRERTLRCVMEQEGRELTVGTRHGPVEMKT